MKPINTPSTAAAMRQETGYNTRPEFIRLPKPGERCPLTGLSRGTLNELCIPTEKNNHRPLVRSHIIKKPGAARGVRLINYASLLKYLHQLPAEAVKEGG